MRQQTVFVGLIASLSYDRLTTELPTGEARGNAFGTRSGVGVVVYF
jgi:hypothetical protein